MGKAFSKEIQLFPTTIEWALETEVTRLAAFIKTISHLPLVAVGSGGSYTAAVYMSMLHEYRFGKIGKAISPYEMIKRPTHDDAAVAFLTAGGGNADIVSGWKSAEQRDYSHLLALVLREGSRLSKIACGSGRIIDYTLPTGRDGFLATNTLLATLCLLFRAYGDIGGDWPKIDTNLGFSDLEAPPQILDAEDWIVLAGGWSWPAAVDLESKCSEATLTHVLLSDLRSFGHGRHLWLGKRPEKAAVIMIVTEDEWALASRTLELIPSEVPRLVLKSESRGPLASISQLLNVVSLVQHLGQRRGIDPGRPGVPTFGGKIYHLGPVEKVPKSDIEKTWIRRKQRAMGIAECEPDHLRVHLAAFIEKMNKSTFSAVVLDYDGTISDPDKRFDPLSEEITTELIRILSCGIRVGIATGRGKSAFRELKSAIPPNFHDNVLVGLYNGGTILHLSDSLGNSNPSDQLLARVARFLQKYDIHKINMKQDQISITPDGGDLIKLQMTIRHLLATETDLQISRSSHSVDIFKATSCKLNVVRELQRYGTVLAIGDSGLPGGNDEELLSTPYSLSCFEPTADPTTGWHLAPSGYHFAKAAARYLRALKGSINSGIHLDINDLRR